MPGAMVEMSVHLVPLDMTFLVISVANAGYIMRLNVKQFSLLSCCFLSLGPNYFLRHFKHLESVCFFTSVKNFLTSASSNICYSILHIRVFECMR